MTAGFLCLQVAVVWSAVVLSISSLPLNVESAPKLLFLSANFFFFFLFSPLFSLFITVMYRSDASGKGVKSDSSIFI